MDLVLTCEEKKKKRFELVWMIRRISLSAAITITPVYTPIRRLCVVAICICYLLYHQKCQPFRIEERSTRNFLEYLSLATIAITYSALPKERSLYSYFLLLLNGIVIACYGIVFLIALLPQYEDPNQKNKLRNSSSSVGSAIGTLEKSQLEVELSRTIGEKEEELRLLKRQLNEFQENK